MYNNIILEGNITDIEYTIPEQNELLVNGTISSAYTERPDSKFVLYFHIDRELAKEYYKKLMKNKKAILEGRLEFIKYGDNETGRYSMNVKKIQILDKDEVPKKRFNVLYSREKNSFII